MASAAVGVGGFLVPAADNNDHRIGTCDNSEQLMSPIRIAGFVVMVAGIALFIYGINASHSVADRWSNFFTGHFTDSTMWYMAAGLAIAVAGVLVTAFGGRVVKQS
jgi:hypothetical protein